MSDTLKTIIEVGGAVLGLGLGGITLYKFIMWAVNEKIKAVLDVVNAQLQPVKELAEEALEKGIAIETNYRAQFKETNANVQATREQVLERFGKTEGVLLNVESMLKLMMSHFTFNSHGDKQ